jgi:hypothetical protein
VVKTPEQVFGELIPERDLPDRVTKHAARQLAEELADEPVTSAQFAAFARAGLIAPPGPDRLLPGSAVNQLVAAKRASTYARPLARRVVFLRGYYFLFPVPADKLQQALIDLVPLVRQPARKLARVSRHGQSSDRGRLRHRRPPPVKEWATLIAEVDPARIDAWAMGWYAMAREYIPSHYAPAPNPLDAIPLEDQVLCLAVLDIDRRSEVSLQGG